MTTQTANTDITTDDLAAAAADLQQAQAEADIAQQAADGLEARVLAGDTTVSPDDLTQAAGLTRFAQLRAEAAANRHAVAAVAARQHVLDALAADARDYAARHGFDGSKTIDAALAAFEASIATATRKFLEAEARQEADFDALDAEATRLDVPAVDLRTGSHNPPYLGSDTLAVDRSLTVFRIRHGASTNAHGQLASRATRIVTEAITRYLDANL